jgi:taurine transport system substrate-binding protein
MTMRGSLTRRAALAGGLGLGAAATFGRASARAAAPPDVQIGFFVETKPTMIAKSLGWFADAMKAKIAWHEMGAGAEINTGIAAGGLDFGLAIGSSPVAAGIAQDLGYHLIGMVDNIGPAEEMTVRASAHIAKPADFIGKNIGTPFGSTSHFRLMGFLALNHLSQSQVSVLDMSPQQIVAAWQRGDIDAAYVWSPAKAQILAAGGAVYETYKELDAAGYVIADLIVVRTAFARRYPDAVAAFLGAYGKALDFYRTDPQKAVAVVAKAAGVGEAVAKADLAEYDFVPLKTQLTGEWLGPPGHPGKFASVLHGTALFLQQQKSIRAVPPLASFDAGIDTSYLAKAVG